MTYRANVTFCCSSSFKAIFTVFTPFTRPFSCMVLILPCRTLYRRSVQIRTSMTCRANVTLCGSSKLKTVFTVVARFAKSLPHLILILSFQAYHWCNVHIITSMTGWAYFTRRTAWIFSIIAWLASCQAIITRAEGTNRTNVAFVTIARLVWSSGTSHWISLLDENQA